MTHIHLTNWNISGFWPYTPVFNRSMETGCVMDGVTPCIPAQVPGSVYRDLQNAGLIEDPNIGMNSLKCEWVANRWWVYECHFDAPVLRSGERARLIFYGIDYEAIIHLNGAKLAEHTGMYTHCVCDVTDTLREKGNVLVVILKSAPDEMGQIGFTSQTHTQKARFNYKWDFCTRLVNLGLYRPVELTISGSTSIENVKVETDNSGRVTAEFALSSAAACIAELACTLSLNGAVLSEQCKKADLSKGKNTVLVSFQVEDPRLWFPNGAGEQPLYVLAYTLTDPAGSFSGSERFGFREISYICCKNAAAGSLPYLPVINGRKTYLKGVNMVPLDMLYGTVTKEQYRAMLLTAKEANINLVRVWGGGLIESPDFYDLCDELGLLVWQEFIQSSSGIDNIPSEKPEFLELLKKTAETAVSDLRNHPCLCYYGGGNELMEAPNVPVTYENENIAMLKEICDRLDPSRLMLPSSASGPREFLASDHAGMNHDVHGPWQFNVQKAYYTLYNESDSQLHSEFGCNGMSSIATLKKILPPQDLGVFDNANYTWRHHGEWWNALQRDRFAAGELKDLQEYADVDRFLQAEAIRYGIESNRRRAFANCGSIIWVFNEPWANTANTALIDYYGDKKPAYFAVRNAYKPQHVSLKYDWLFFAPGSLMTAEAFVHNDGSAQPFVVRWQAKTARHTLQDGILHADASNGEAAGAGQLSVQTGSEPFVITLTLEGQNGIIDENRYLFLPDLPDRAGCGEAIGAFLSDCWNC